MSTVKRYLILIETFHSSVFDRFYDYCKYSTCNFVMLDGESFLIDSYLNIQDLIDQLYNLSSSTKFFAAEITGEITWRNAGNGFNSINNFLNKKYY